ncbi:MAG: sigma-70 family RNA polymerase sigma factor [Pseudomonadota bacterium]
MDSSEEARVIAEVLRGEGEAYAILVKRYQKPIFNLMKRMTMSAEDALDLSQDAFIKAYENLEKYSPGRPFFPWLYAIGLNLARDFLRKKKKNNLVVLPRFEDSELCSSSAPQEEELLGRMEAAEVARALLKLSPDYREALALRYQEDLPLADVAQCLGLSLSGAKMRVHRGLALLRQVLLEERNDRKTPRTVVLRG